MHVPTYLPTLYLKAPRPYSSRLLQHEVLEVFRGHSAKKNALYFNSISSWEKMVEKKNLSLFSSELAFHWNLRLVVVAYTVALYHPRVFEKMLGPPMMVYICVYVCV